MKETLIASVSTDLKIHNGERAILSYGNRKDASKVIKWSDDGKYIVQSGVGIDVEVLSVTEERIRSLQHVPIENSTVAVFRHGPIRNLAVGCRSGKTSIWDLRVKRIIKTFTAGFPVKLLHFNCKDVILAAALDNGDTNLFSMTTNVSLDVIKVPNSKSVSSLTFHNKVGSWLAIATEEGSLLLRDINNGKDKMFSKMAHAAPISGTVFSSVHNDVLVTCSYDKKISIHDVRLQTVVSVIETDKFLSSLDMDAESFVASGTSTGEILIYDLRNYMEPFKIFKDHKSTVTSVAFRPVGDKAKINFNTNISIKDMYGPKIVNADSGKTPANKTYEDASFCNLINTTFSPVGDSVDSRNGNVIKNLDSSSLLNIIDSTNNSCMTNFDSKECAYSDKLNMASDSPRLISQNLLEIDNRNSISTSTPVLNKTHSVDITSSKIESVIKNECDGDDNFYQKTVNNVSLKKPVESMASPSETETVVCNKCSSNCLLNLSNDIKDHITYSMYDIIDNCRANHYRMVLIETRNRIFLEDQIHSMNKKMEGMQQLLCTVLEENKKLSIEMEMLRAARK